MCAYLVEIETIEESDWLAATFLMKGKLCFIGLNFYTLIILSGCFLSLNVS